MPAWNRASVGDWRWIKGSKWSKWSNKHGPADQHLMSILPSAPHSFSASGEGRSSTHRTSSHLPEDLINEGRIPHSVSGALRHVCPRHSHVPWLARLARLARHKQKEKAEHRSHFTQKDWLQCSGAICPYRSWEMVFTAPLSLVCILLHPSRHMPARFCPLFWCAISSAKPINW